jgi:hypothetical protein
LTYIKSRTRSPAWPFRDLLDRNQGSPPPVRGALEAPAAVARRAA